MPVSASRLRHEPLRFLGLLVLVHAIGFAPQWATGRLLSAADFLYSMEPFDAVRPDPARSYRENLVLSDASCHIDPWCDDAARRLARGELPLWNPHQFAGAPLFANAECALAFPPNLLRLALPPGAAALPIAFVLVLAAGLFTSLLARRVGLGFWPAALAGIAFSLAPWLHVNLLLPLSSVAALLPMSAWAADVLAESPSRRAAAGLAGALALQQLGGHPETALHCAGFTTVWFLFRSWPALRDRARRAAASRGLVLFGLAGVVALLVAGVQLVPFVEYLRESATWRSRSASPPNASFPALIGWQLVTLFVPDAFGHPMRETFWGKFAWTSLVLYAGIPTIALAILGAWRGGARRTARFLLAVAAVAGVVALRIPGVVDVVAAIPVLGVANNARLTSIVQFAVALAAGIGLDALLRATPDERRGLRRAAVVVALALVLACGASLALVVAPLREHGGLAAIGSSLGAFAALAAGFAALPFLRPGVAAVAACALVAADLLAFALPLHPALEPALRYPTTPAIEFLRSRPEPFRIAGLGRALHPNLATEYGIDDVRGCDALTPWRYDLLMRRIDPAHGDALAKRLSPGAHAAVVEWLTSGDATVLGRFAPPLERERVRRLRDDWLESSLSPEAFLRGRARGVAHRILVEDVDSPIYDLLGVRYVVAPRGTSPPRRCRPLWSGEVEIFENPLAMPRAFLVGEVEVAGSAAGALDRLVDASFDFRSRAVLEEAPDLPPRAAGAATIVASRADEIVVDTDAPDASLLVVTESRLPGVVAECDGRPVRVLDADVAFRGVALPPGRHRVRVCYRPRSIVWGAAASVAGLAMLAIVSFRRTPRNAARPIS
jgi:hypothetical protein